MMKKIDIRRFIEEGDEPLDRRMIENLTRRNAAAQDPLMLPHPKEAELLRRLRTKSRTTGKTLFEGAYSVMAVLICIGIIAVLLYSAMDLPKFGGAETFVDNAVSTFYVEEGVTHTNAQNIVTGIILDFRGFDTLGESHVLFIAVCTVLMMLRLPKGNSPSEIRERMEAEAEDRNFEPADDLILQNGALIIVPLIFIFGIYILLNGQLSPGGGFSGGAVLGAGMILFLSAYGFERAERFFTFETFRVLTTCALVFYAISKGYVFFTGANGLNNGISTGTFGSIFSGGLLMPLSMAVGLVVGCTMYALYTLFRKGDM